MILLYVVMISSFVYVGKEEEKRKDEAELSEVADIVCYNNLPKETECKVWGGRGGNAFSVRSSIFEDQNGKLNRKYVRSTSLSLPGFIETISPYWLQVPNL